MTKLLPPQPWMSSPGAKAVLAALDHQARWVGGCVRDALLGRSVRDLDIATPLAPETVLLQLQQANIRAIPTGIAHGTITALVHDQRFEITTLRRDISTDGRHAQVEFTDDWQADAARRDFTMNALFAAPDGTLHDYFGGLDDLAAGHVRFVGNPLERITEDVLRLLRFFRFHAHYGRGAPDPVALAACAVMAAQLPRLSGERVRTEILRLLEAGSAAAVWALMLAQGVIQHMLPQATNTLRLAALVKLEKALGQNDPLRRLAALLPDEVAVLEQAAAVLRLSNKEQERLTALIKARSAIPLPADAAAMRRAFYHWGPQPVIDAALLAAARLAASDAEPLQALLENAASWERPALPITGDDAMAAGIVPGPAMGAALRQVEAWWIEQDFRPDHEACLAELQRPSAVSNKL